MIYQKLQHHNSCEEIIMAIKYLMGSDKLEYESVWRKKIRELPKSKVGRKDYYPSDVIWEQIFMQDDELSAILKKRRINSYELLVMRAEEYWEQHRGLGDEDGIGI